MGVKVIPLLHNVSSPQRVVEVAKAAYGLGYDIFVVSKPAGAAAQSGVPEAQRIALREGKTLVVLPSIEVAAELLGAETLVFVVSRKFADKPLEEVIKSLAGKGAEQKVLMVFGGAEPGLSAREMEMGERVYVSGIGNDVGPTALAVIALYVVRNLLSRQS
uniref:Exonuclease n=1 Tax=Thermofilum pendens TaxID=2269 RepID=A0A7C1P071_THEPE